MSVTTRPATPVTTSTASDKRATVPASVVAEMREALEARRNEPPPPPVCGPCEARRRHLLTKGQWLRIGCEHAIEGQP